MDENHCQQSNCECAHTECIRGWIDFRYKDVQKRRFKGEDIIVERWYDGTRFCPVCHPERAEIQATANSSAEMTQQLKGLSPKSRLENYEKQEASKTRIL